MRIKLKGVFKLDKRLKNGRLKTYYYVRHVGALNPLPGEEDLPFYPGSEAFMRAYQALNEAPRRARTAGTLQQIIDGYQKSSAFAKLAQRTKADYLGHLDKIAVAKLTKNGPEFATYPLDAVESPKIRKLLLDWRDTLAKRSPRQADATLGVLRIILEWARDRGMIAHNHATRPKKVYKADRSTKLWLPEHIEAFRKVAKPELVLALEVALWTGQRQADVLTVPWKAYQDGRLRFVQGKRKRQVDMPVYSHLRAILDALPRRGDDEPILTTSKGVSWTVKPRPVFFQHSWRQATLSAGLDGLHFHDIRGTTCTMLSDAGCTPSEIASMLGWTPGTVNEMLERYQAMTATQSDSAVAKLEAHRAQGKIGDEHEQ